MDIDIPSMLIGAVIGAIITGLVTYKVDKYTDRRRKKESKDEEETIWKSICDKYPAIIKEIKEDLSNPETSHGRKFYIKPPGAGITNIPEYFYYEAAKHKNIEACFNMLEQNGYIEDISEENLKKYLMYEHFVDKLI